MPRALATTLALSLLASLAGAQPATPPQVMLGQRLQAMRDQVKYLPVVVIVSDPRSYIEAVGSWTRVTRYPVLIDDGSPASREEIARFVRGYAPASVVRWDSPGATATPGAAAFGASATTQILNAVQRVWGIASPSAEPTALATKWQDLKHLPPGLVVTAPNDPAWTAALPLAAAWGQPLLFLEKPPEGNIDWSMSIADADALEARIEQAAKETGCTWSAMGDQLEAITLCLNAPERIKKDNEFVALTDRIGRQGQGLEMKSRWAWTGHIFGSAAQAANRAMCSLFLPPRRAWIFDGYPDTSPWNAYDGTKARMHLEQSGLACELDDTPSQGAAAWRTRCSKPVTADLILVNTKGNNDFFDLEPGQCRPGDLPILTRPAALHFVHSWSLLFPGKRESVGGRWFERGVFVYAGSVHEPFLQAFTPTPTVAARLMGGAPFAPAIRLEGQPVWKIAVLGDPLYTPGPAVERVNDPLPLEGATPVDNGLKQMLLNGEWDRGVLALKLTGRDAEIAKIASTLLETKPEAFTPPMLRSCILASFRAARPDLVLKLLPRLGADAAGDGELLDAAWLVAMPLLTRPDPAIAEPGQLLRLLKDLIRPDQFEADAKVVHAAWSTQFGAAAANQLVSEWRRKHTSKEQGEFLDKLR
jgi:hypothetical protein